MKSLNLLLLIKLCLLFSCASSVTPKSYDQAKRVEYLEDKASLDYEKIKPKFYYTDKAKNLVRMPASMPKEISGVNEPLRVSYFKAIWKQKKDLEKILDITSTNMCPRFHNLVIDQSSSIDEKFLTLKEMTKKVSRLNDPLIYPVLALPYKGVDLFSYSNQYNLSDNDLYESLKQFYEISVNEVESLCEKGVSDGYFITKNLVELYSSEQNDLESSREYLEAMLKTPYVANLYVINSFKHSQKLNMNIAENMLKHLKATWFTAYLESIDEFVANRISKKVDH